MMVKNVTEGIEPFPFLSYQQALWDRLSQGGFKQGQIALHSAGRQTGKSMYMNLLKTRYYGTNLCKEIVLPIKPVSKYKFSRSKWYEADYNLKDYNEVMDWCDEHFGPHPAQPDAWSRWIDKGSWSGPGKVHFRDAKDYEWFLLRWGQ
jgi:hypothetical protein